MEEKNKRIVIAVPLLLIFVFLFMLYNNRAIALDTNIPPEIETNFELPEVSLGNFTHRIYDEKMERILKYEPAFISWLRDVEISDIAIKLRAENSVIQTIKNIDLYVNEQYGEKKETCVPRSNMMLKLLHENGIFARTVIGTVVIDDITRLHEWLELLLPTDFLICPTENMCNWGTISNPAYSIWPIDAGQGMGEVFFERGF